VSLPDLKSTLVELHRELEQVDRVDPELQQLLQQLDRDIRQLTEPDASVSAHGNYAEQLAAYEAEFSIEYPQLAGVFRSLLQTLHSIGI